MNDLQCPPSNLDVTGLCEYQVFLLWCKSFHGYSKFQISWANNWWNGIKNCCRENFPIIESTFLPPLSEIQIDNIIKDIKIPPELRILYRFHNGQRRLVKTDVLLGLFGGTSFYNELCCTRLLNLEDLVSLNYEAISKIKERLTILNNGGYTPSNTTDRLIFAMSYKGLKDKHFSLALNLNNFVITKSNNLDYMICHPQRIPNQVHPLHYWLSEYLLRLQRKVYCYQPLDLTATPPLPIQSETLQMIALYPLLNIHSEPASAVTCISNGVQVTVCPTFIPQLSSISLEQSKREYIWSYSVRLKLCGDHPSCPLGMSSCQLTRRHWVITHGGHVNEVDGEAVVGLYPLLQSTVTTEFAYQSCTVNSCEGTFAGYMTFVPGSIANPTGPPFQVHLPTATLALPNYIY